MDVDGRKKHVVEVTAKRRLFRSCQVTPISTLKNVYSRRRPVTGLSVSGTWGKKSYCWHYVLTKKHQRRKKKHTKFKYSYMDLGNTWLACSSMTACLRCHTLVNTNLLRYVLCCSVQGRLKVVLLCLRYVVTVAFGDWFSPSWRAQEKTDKKLYISWFDGISRGRDMGS